MPRRKIPPDAFDFYFGLGPGRSYQAVAGEYGVTKRAVTKLAAKERWQDQIAALERKARENSDERKVDALQASHEQRLQALRMVLGPLSPREVREDPCGLRGAYEVTTRGRNAPHAAPRKGIRLSQGCNEVATNRLV